MTFEGADRITRRDLLAGGALWLLVGCQSEEAPQPQKVSPASPVANHAPEPVPDPGQSGEIRVSLTDDPVEGVELKFASETEVFDLLRERRLATWPAKTRIELRRKSGGWSWGDESLTGQRLELRPAVSPGIWVNDHLYRGVVRLIPTRGASFRVVNHLPLEHYLAGVIDGEMPGGFPLESRKAQAVAARSFAVMQRVRVKRDAEYDLFASAGRSQRYLGAQYRDARGPMAGESDSARRAVRETGGLICTRQGELFRTYYSACCGGKTTRGVLYFPDAGDLPSVDCNACEDCPKHHWLLRLTAEEFSAAVRKSAPGASKTFLAAEATVTGARSRDSLCEAIIRDVRGTTLKASGVALRSAIGTNRLYSAWFTIRREKEDFVFEGRGFGHGVGLCQWGAAGHAQRGADFRAILKRYYPGCDVQPIAAHLLTFLSRHSHDHRTCSRSHV